MLARNIAWGQTGNTKQNDNIQLQIYIPIYFIPLMNKQLATPIHQTLDNLVIGLHQMNIKPSDSYFTYKRNNV